MSQTVPPATPPAGDGGPSPWHRLMMMARPRATKANAFAALLAVILGFAVATQVRQNQALGLESLRHDELVSGNTDGAAALTAAQERLDALRILAGTAAAHGPGIRMTILDPGAKVSPPILLDAIEELRDAGAEAVQVDDVRVVASSYFGVAASGVEIDGTKVTQPYTIVAIGDPQTMSSAMQIPGGLSENVRGLGATITIASDNALTVTALHTLTEPRYARPVAPPASAATQ